ncbi:MAG: sigma-54-dependent Fis family transcriptional regulator [SAR86 cluster bacterium]|uniref:Sigma-54-dependent Fis family transcriptional regulator n=1 Tax=SAR86 cluster bacterium TaxID=2030880 RepID=A0A2A4MH82_9GAMM|nr:MAG: sigma-54-dependent Fis family transcriptional regulator [SAR86 cluster bacterium]
MPKIRSSAEPYQRILIVDDDSDVLLSAKLILKAGHKQIQCLTNPSDIANAFQQDNFDVVLLDMNFTRGLTTGEEGFFWLRKIKQLSEDTQVIMSTAYGEIDLAVEAIKQGAADFLVKPWSNEKLISTVNTCCALSRSRQKIRQLKNTQVLLNEKVEAEFTEMIGTSSSMRQVFELVDKVADTDASVLILGENGTGKELIARAIHRRSSRHNHPMISVDLGAISENLFESEMFGHKRGAFTDARENRAGRFETANGGSLFLDEIGNLNLALQAKLLGVLESRSISRVGSDKSLAIDIRLICATNMPARKLADDRLFRKDLLYRINTVEVSLPPLRERQSDIPLLIQHYIKVFAHKYNKPEIQPSPAEIRKLQSYNWPGNIRELKHSIERAVIVSNSSTINIANMFMDQSLGNNNAEELNISKLEKRAIKQAIIKHQGNLTRVAKALGLGRTTLYRKMEKYELVEK